MKKSNAGKTIDKLYKVTDKITDKIEEMLYRMDGSGLWRLYKLME